MACMPARNNTASYVCLTLVVTYSYVVSVRSSSWLLSLVKVSLGVNVEWVGASTSHFSVTVLDKLKGSWR